MQRNAFPPPNTKSPELFHPRPQHISQVPMMRSPPPPISQQQQQQQQSQPQMNNYGGNPYGGGGGGFAPNFGGFMNDPTAQMGFQVGKSAVMAGQEYMEQSVSCLCNGGCRCRHTNLLTLSLHQNAEILMFLSCSWPDISPSQPWSIISTSPIHMWYGNCCLFSSHGDTSPGPGSRLESRRAAQRRQLTAKLSPRNSIQACISHHATTWTVQTCTFLSWPSSHTFFFLQSSLVLEDHSTQNYWEALQALHFS